MEIPKVESAAEVGFTDRGLEQARDVLLQAVAARIFPGCVAVVGRGGKLVAEWALGRLGDENDLPPVSNDTIYDLASLTKVVATTTLVMILCERGQLTLDGKVHDYLPEFSGPGKDDIELRDLLSHSSGVLWWKDLYRLVNVAWSMTQVHQWYVQQVSLLPLDYRPRTKSVYSDLGTILLGAIVERVSGQGLDKLARANVFQPLGMRDTGFNPSTASQGRIAPTGWSDWRDRFLVGEAHDDNAAAMGGVAPHAGLFSTGRDLAVFAQMMLNHGSLGDRHIAKRSMVERFTRRVDGVPESTRALGWDTPSRVSTAGRYFSESSYGHLGFTGTSLWIDPVRDLYVVLLANRLNPSRDQTKINRLRASFHDAVMEALVEVPAPRTY